MGNAKQAVAILIDTIDTAISKKIKTARINTTVKGRITASLGSNNYSVLVDGHTYTVKSHFTHAVNDLVVIVVCNHNWNEMYVLY